MKALSRELDYRIRYDVEHDLFHAQNVFNTFWRRNVELVRIKDSEV